MSRIFRILTTTVLLIIAISLLAACGSRDRMPVYADSEEIDPIEAPPGMTQPQVRSTYDVPGYYLPELAARGNEARPPSVQPSAEAERSRAQIRFGQTGLFLEVRAEPDSVWQQLGDTLNDNGMTVRQTDESERKVRFMLSHEGIEAERRGFSRLAFWRSPEVTDYSGYYQIEVRSEGRAGDSARLILLDADGEILDMEQAEYVLARLRDQLG